MAEDNAGVSLAGFRGLLLPTPRTLPDGTPGYRAGGTWLSRAMLPPPPTMVTAGLVTQPEPPLVTAAPTTNPLTTCGVTSPRAGASKCITPDVLGRNGSIRARARYQEASNGQARCHRGPISGWFRLDGPEQSGVPGVSERGLSGLGEV